MTVFEREDKIGGLLRYGIPNMKLEKWVIDRKVEIMKEEGITFVTGANVGKDIKAAKLMKEYDRVVLACGCVLCSTACQCSCHHGCNKQS